jgi:hypothetical protein
MMDGPGEGGAVLTIKAETKFKAEWEIETQWSVIKPT